MIIFIDTNVIYGHYHLQNPNLQYLLNYLENTNSTLAVSEIVCDEIDNKFNTELNAITTTLTNNIKKFQTLSNTHFDFPELELKEAYSFKKLLQNRSDKVKYFPYIISNDKLVLRAIKKIRPFKEDDKGFRDTLIWLSFLEYLKINPSDEIAFINNNSSDFYNLDKTDFHEDLKKDIKVYGLTNIFKVYDSIKDFINKEVGTKHKYTADIIMAEFIHPQESMIEEMVESYINSQSLTWFTELLKEHSKSFDKLAYLSSFNFDIMEGIEDPELLSWEQIEENKFFGELRFFLRIVNIQLTFPSIVYNENKSSFPTKNQVEVNKDYVTMTLFSKVYLNISFNFDTNTKVVENLEINLFGLL